MSQSDFELPVIPPVWQAAKEQLTAGGRVFIAASVQTTTEARAQVVGQVISIDLENMNALLLVEDAFKPCFIVPEDTLLTLNGSDGNYCINHAPT